MGKIRKMINIEKLEKVKEDMCDYYCFYSQKIEGTRTVLPFGGDYLVTMHFSNPPQDMKETICINCPLNRL